MSFHLVFAPACHDSMLYLHTSLFLEVALGGLNDGNRLELSKYQTDVKAKGNAFKVKSDIIKETIKAKAANDKRSDDASRDS